MKKIVFLLTILLIAGAQAYAQPDTYSKDTVWKKNTGFSSGFYYVKFSNTDSLIVAHGLDKDIFFETKTGKEIIRLQGNNKIFFINADKNFIRLNEDNTTIEVFDTKKYQVVDTIENDGSSLDHNSMDLSKDGRYFVSYINGGIRTWDVEEKKILKTKYFETETNMTSLGISSPVFTSNGLKIVGMMAKSFKDPKPGEPDHITTVGYTLILDALTLDSLDIMKNALNIRLSNTDKYIAFHNYDGVEVYKFKEKEKKVKFDINGYNVTGIEFSPDEKYLYLSSGPSVNRIAVYDIEKGEEVYHYNNASFEGISISNDGKYIATHLQRFVILLNAYYGSVKTKEDININNLIYPNPSTGKAVIKLDKEIQGIINISLTNESGQLVKQSEEIANESNEIDIDVHELLNGKYFITLQNDKYISTLHLVINK
jgi:WD40 repeat protein